VMFVDPDFLVTRVGSVEISQRHLFCGVTVPATVVLVG
jgi:hypothetical protein